jgi:hypothetical protein
LTNCGKQRLTDPALRSRFERILGQRSTRFELKEEITMADKPLPITASAARAQVPASSSTAAPAAPQQQNAAQTRAFIVAWFFTVIFYFLEYAVRSSPSVMISGLEDHFSTTALGIASILGVYYYTYSSMSLVAGAALDHPRATRSVPAGRAILG